VLRDHVHALFDHRLRGVGFLRRVEPGVGPDHHKLDVRVHLLRVQEVGVYPLDDLGDREGGDVADLVGLGHLARDVADDRPALVEAGVIGGEVVGALVARRVLELDVGKLLGHVHRGVHEAEGRGEDEPRAGQRHLGQDALGVGAFGHVLLVDRLDPVAVGGFHRKPALVVLEGPAAVADGADVDEADLERRLRAGGQAERGGRGGGRAGEEERSSFHGSFSLL
jgi:hypothetical protein